MTLAASGEFGLRTSCPPEWTEDTRASHGVTVGHLRPTPGHNVITPNQEGFMDSSWAPGLSQTNQQCSLSLKKNCAKMFCPRIQRKPQTWRSPFTLNSFSTVFAILAFRISISNMDALVVILPDLTFGVTCRAQMLTERLKI